jgi:hypothetical protein
MLSFGKRLSAGKLPVIGSLVLVESSPDFVKDPYTPLV